MGDVPKRWNPIRYGVPILFVLGVAACALIAADNYRDAQGRVRTGKLSMRHVKVKRNYYMYIPTTYTPRKAYPLVVSAPGTFPFDSSPGTRDSWVAQAEKHGFIVCCPDFETATGLLNVKADKKKLSRDETRVAAIIKEVRSRYNINPDGIFITGWSGGGYPAHYLGLTRPDLFRGIIGRTANFSEDLVDDETARKARHRHVFCFFGKSDLVSIPEQNRRAHFWYTVHGFQNFEIKEVPGGHAKNNDLAAEWLMKIVTQWPVARIRASTLSGRAPLVVNFRALASDPNGTIVSYVWQFDDGGVSIRQSTQHTFTRRKVYNVFLTVTDNDGNKEQAQVDIEVK